MNVSGKQFNFWTSVPITSSSSTFTSIRDPRNSGFLRTQRNETIAYASVIREEQTEETWTFTRYAAAASDIFLQQEE